MNSRKRMFTYLVRMGIVIELLVLAGCSPSCTNNNTTLTATPSFTLAFKGTDGNLHVRWSADGQTWKDPDTISSTIALDQGPGFGGTPNGLSQLLVLNRGTTLFHLSSLGPAEWGTGPAVVLQTGVTTDSPVSVEFTGSGNWLFAHRTGNDGVLRTWDGSATSSTTVVTPPGALLNLCVTDALSGPIGPKVIQLNGKVLVAFCQRDGSGNESIQLIPGTLAANGTPTFASQVAFTATRPGFDAPLAKIYALAHDGTNFLLATVAPESSQPGPLTTFGLLIFSSPDGQTWTFVTQTSKNSGLNLSARSTTLAIAALPRSNAPALIQVAQVAGSSATPNLWEFNGTTWTNRTTNNAFGSAALDGSAGFAFRVNGTP